MNKEAYNFLNSARVLHWQWLRLKAKHDELESCLLPAAIRYDKDKVMTSPEDQMSKIVAEVNELEKEVNELKKGSLGTGVYLDGSPDYVKDYKNYKTLYAII